MSDLSPAKTFAVIGSPVKHSRSPAIHAQFARQTGITLQYGLLESPLDQFTRSVALFFKEGGNGLNVTVPFKEEAYALCADRLSPRARLAGAVNTLWMRNSKLHGCNTDGVGLLADIARLNISLKDRHVLLVGAGGAARGVVFPLLEAGCASLRIVNRNPKRAQALENRVNTMQPQYASQLTAGGLDEAQGSWDIIINASASSLTGEAPALKETHYTKGALAYDMMYAAKLTPFLVQAQALGASVLSDGLGMLVEQAAESFLIWHGLRPDTSTVLAQLRADLAASLA